METLDLPTRLAQALKFDYIGAVDSSLKWDALNRGGYELFKDGAEYENARLAPLHRALVECVTALDDWRKHIGYDHVEALPKPPSYQWCSSRTHEALASLDTAIKEVGSETNRLFDTELPFLS